MARTRTVPVIIAGVAPTGIAAPIGTIYVNTVGNSTSTRLYVNSDGGTTWIAITTSS